MTPPTAPDAAERDDDGAEPDAVHERREGGGGRRRAVAVVGLLVAALVAVVATTSGAVTPSEHAARREPPPTTPVTASPRRQVIQDVRTGVCQVAIATTDVVSAGAPPGTEVAVFTQVDVQAGAPVTPGQRLVEVSGRPVLALPLPFPLYRDLAPGVEGTDVEALQDALASLGLLGDHRHGTFDWRTQEAVTDLYENAGEKAQRTGPELDQAVTLAEQQVTDVQQRIDAGEVGIEGELEAARDALSAAKARRGVVVPRAEIVAVGVDQTVVAVAAAVGATADAGTAIASVGSAQPSATCTFAPAATAGLAAGQAATLRSADGTEFAGTIGALQDVEAQQQTVFTPTDAPLPASAAGTQAPIEVVVAGTPAEVLAVPAHAIQDLPDGGVAVETIDGDRRSLVPVDIGMVAAGWVEVVDPPFDTDAVLVLGPPDDTGADGG